MTDHPLTTTDKLFQFADADGAQADQATKEAHRSQGALHEGRKGLSSRPVNTNMAEVICSQITGVEMTVREVPGTALAKDETAQVIYTPPEGEGVLRDLLGNWQSLLRGQPELDPLIRMAVMHYQFEAVHPVTDANSRNGRILNSLYLVQEKLFTLPILVRRQNLLDRLRPDLRDASAHQGL